MFIKNWLFSGSMFIYQRVYHVSCVSDRIVERNSAAQPAEGEPGSPTSEAFNKVLGMARYGWEIP